MTHDSDLLAVAKRVVWFESPEETLRDTTLFLNHVMTHGGVRDVLTVREHFDDQALRHALREACPGVFDPRFVGLLAHRVRHDANTGAAHSQDTGHAGHEAYPVALPVKQRAGFGTGRSIGSAGPRNHSRHQ